MHWKRLLIQQTENGFKQIKVYLYSDIERKPGNSGFEGKHLHQGKLVKGDVQSAHVDT